MVWQRNGAARQWILTQGDREAFQVFGLLRVSIFRRCPFIPLPEIRLPCIALLPTSALPLTAFKHAKVVGELIQVGVRLPAKPV